MHILELHRDKNKANTLLLSTIAAREKHTMIQSPTPNDKSHT